MWNPPTRVSNTCAICTLVPRVSTVTLLEGWGHDSSGALAKGYSLTMNIEITHVRYGATSRTFESIVRYKWQEIGGDRSGDTDKPSMVAWVDTASNGAYVNGVIAWVPVESVHPTYGDPYLRTVADGTPTNNLLELPTF